jgi:hypothetical protein
MAKREVRKRHFLFVMWDGAGGTIVEARIIKKLLRRGHAVTVPGPAALEDRLRSLGCDYVLDQAMAPYSSVRDYPLVSSSGCATICGLARHEPMRTSWSLHTFASFMESSNIELPPLGPGLAVGQYLRLDALTSPDHAECVWKVLKG